MDIKALIGRSLPEETYEIEGVGEIRFRSLSRSEVIQMRNINDLDETEVFIAATCFVDPPLTEDDARIWLKNADTKEVNEVMNEILVLSRIIEGAQKSD